MLKKKVICSALVLATAFSTAAGAISGLTASGETATTQTKKVEIVDEFLISSWVSYYGLGVKDYASQTKELAEAGLNFIWHPTKIGGRESVFTESASVRYDDLDELYKQYGMTYLRDVSTKNATLDDMASLENCIGYYVKDEPSAAQFQATKDLFMQYYNMDSARRPFVNLYPNYAGSTALGGTYSDYVNNWVDTVGANYMEYLYYDHYPFTGTETVRSSYFSDIETIRKVAYANGRMKTGGFSQTGWWSGMRKPNADELRWNLNTFITYGFKSISHFCWVSPKQVALEDGGEDMRDHVIDQDGNKTDIYDPMVQYNWQIRQLGDLLMGIDCAHAYHSGADIADGVEKLPKSFFVQPEDKSSNYIISLFNSKDDSERYIMIMNNSTSETKRSKFTIDASSGVTSLTKFSTTIDSDNLPDPTNLNATMGSLKEENISLSNGYIEEEFLPGEVKIYKLNGDDIVINEGVATPEIALASGSYIGQQEVAIRSAQPNSKIYYTLDGSFPQLDTNGNPVGGTKLYTGPITIGNNGEWKYYGLRAAAIMNGEYSQVVEADYVITDGTRNVTMDADVTFYNKEFTELIQVDNEKQSNVSGAVVVDGYHDPYTEVFTKKDANGQNTINGWAVVDMKQVQRISKIVTSFWANWEFTDVVIQTSVDGKTWQTVFNNDTDGSLQSVTGEIGQDGTYVDSMYSGNVFSFAEREARYIRVHNVGAGGGILTGKSIWQEVSAFSGFDVEKMDNVDLLVKNYSDKSNWYELGGSQWTIDGGKLTLNGTGDWGRAITFTQKKYKNFIIEGTFSMKDVTAGLVGFQLYKTTTNSVLNGDNGYVVFVENGGRVGAYDGVNGGPHEFGGTNIKAANFTPDEFTFRVTSIGDLLTIAINGMPAYATRHERADMEAGYIAVHAGSIGITVSDLWIMELDDTNNVDGIYFEDALYEQAAPVQTAVKVLDTKETALATLPTAVTFTTVGQQTVSVPVTGWVCNDYNRLEAGWNTFTAQLDVSGLAGISNALNLQAVAKVWVSAGFDGAALQEYIDLASSLDPYDFTEDSWKEVEQKLQTAIEIMNDPFTVQNSINVASFQLFDAINALVNVSQDKTALNALLATCNYEESKYTAVTYANYARCLQTALEIADSNIATQTEINNAVKALQTAISKLVAYYDKTALADAVAQAKALDGALYTADSYAALTAAIAQAEDVLAMDKVTASIGELAMNDLTAAKNGLKLISTNKPSEDSTSENSSNDSVISSDNGETPSEDDGGCGSVVSGSGLTILLGVAVVKFIKRKKED